MSPGAEATLEDADGRGKVSLDLTVSVVRVLPDGSKWNGVLALLRTRAESTYFKRRLQRRLLRMRQNLHNLFETVGGSVGWGWQGLGTRIYGFRCRVWGAGCCFKCRVSGASLRCAALLQLLLAHCFSTTKVLPLHCVARAGACPDGTASPLLPG